MVLRSFFIGMENKHFKYLILIHFGFRIISVIEYLLWKDSISLESHMIAMLPINIVLLPLIGYYLENQVDIESVGNKLWILWIINIGCIALSCYVTYLRGIDRGVFSEADSQKYFSYFTFLNCAAVYLTIKYAVARVMPGERIKRFIISISGCCFGIYLIHILFQDLPIRTQLIQALEVQSIHPVIIILVYVTYLYVPSLIMTFSARTLKE